MHKHRVIVVSNLVCNTISFADVFLYVSGMDRNGQWHVRPAFGNVDLFNHFCELDT